MYFCYLEKLKFPPIYYIFLSFLSKYQVQQISSLPNFTLPPCRRSIFSSSQTSSSAPKHLGQSSGTPLHWCQDSTTQCHPPPSPYWGARTSWPRMTQTNTPPFNQGITPSMPYLHKIQHGGFVWGVSIVLHQRTLSIEDYQAPTTNGRCRANCSRIRSSGRHVWRPFRPRQEFLSPHRALIIGISFCLIIAWTSPPLSMIVLRASCSEHLCKHGYIFKKIFDAS